VMSVTVPRLIRFPFESDTLTTALTTADLSLFSKLSCSPVSILAWAVGDDVNVFLLFTPTFRVLELGRPRFGASISSNLARGSSDGGTAPVKMLLMPVSLFLVALYCGFGGDTYCGLGGPTGW